MVDRSAAAKKAAKTKKLRAAGRKAAETKKRSMAAKEAAKTKKGRAAALKAWKARRAKERMEKIRKVEDRLRFGKIVRAEPLREGTHAGLAARQHLLNSGVDPNDIAGEREFVRIFGEVLAKDYEACGGSGIQSRKPCAVCRGIGRVQIKVQRQT